MWTAAALVGAVMLALIGWQVLKPRDVLLGSTSTRAVQAITLPDVGKRLCVPGVALPGGTGTVEMILSTDVPRPGIGLELRGGGHTLSATAPGPETLGQQTYAFPLPRTWPQRLDNVDGEVCIRATGSAFTLLGAARGGTDRRATLALQPADVRLALWFRPPAGERPSLLSQLPDVFERAARFRPAGIGPWTYWLWLLTLPLLWLAGVRLIARNGAGTARRTALAVAAIAFANFAAWALITPPFDAPDEQEHFTYVQNVAERGVDPRQGDRNAILSPDAAVALDAARTFTYNSVPEGRPPWTAVDEARYERAREAGPRPSREPPGIASPAATQPPPFLGPLAPASYGLYAPGYAITATPAYLVARGGSPFTQLTAVRLTSSLLGALTAALACLIMLQLLPALPGAAAAAGLLVAFQPMFGFVSGAANNDNGVNFAAALTLFLLVVALRRGLSVRLGIALGGALVLLPFMKTTGYSFYAVAAIGLAGVLWRARGRFDVRPWLALAGTFLVLQAVWLAIVRAEVGPPPPLVNVNPYSMQAGITGFLSYMWQVFLPRLPFMTDLIVFEWPTYGRIVWVERVWGSFGWLSAQFPPWVFSLVIAAIAIVVAAGVATIARFRHRLRGHGAELALLVATPVLVMLAVHAGLVTLSPRIAPDEQGRYLFPAITALAALAVGACGVLGRRHLPVLAAGLVAAVMGIGFAGQLLWLSATYT